MTNGDSIALHTGTAGSRDVVLLHGIPGSSRSWDAVIALLPADLRPIVPDLLGFGASDRTTSPDDLHAAGQADLLAEALDDVIRPGALLVGHDFGGPVAVHLLQRMPERFSGLLLAATNLFADTPVPFPLSLVSVPVIGPAVARLLFSRPSLAGICRFAARSGQVNVGASLGDSAQSRAIAIIFQQSLTRLAELYRPIEQIASSIALPVAVLWGDRDPFFPIAQADRTAHLFREGRLTVLDGCGHFVPEERPDAVADQIRELAAIRETSDDRLLVPAAAHR